MKSRFILLFVFLLKINFNANAQEIKLYGKVIDNATGNPVSSVSITAKGEDFLQSSLSDISGEYIVSLKTKLSDIQIAIIFKYLGYRTDTVFYKLDSRARDQNGHIPLELHKMSQSAISLEEVKIKKPKRYRDTAYIDLTKEKYERSVAVEDLLSGSLGFSRRENGLLYYKGQIVSKLQVNNSDFFGENNQEIYKNLPALVLEGIQIIQTDIDSVSNITMKNPSIKINLKLKEKYQRGKLGNASAGAGSLERRVTSTSLYSYANNEQISLLLNSNNINIANTNSGDSPLGFSAAGNNIMRHLGSFTYRNIFYKKLEVMALAEGRKENRVIESSSERKDEFLNQYSSTFNSSTLKQSGLDNSSVTINYRPDTNNVLKAVFSKNITDVHQNDSLAYDILLNNSGTLAEMKKTKVQLTKITRAVLLYSHTFPAKGRALDIHLQYDYSRYTTQEYDNIRSFTSKDSMIYNVDFKSMGNDGSISVNAKYTEPLSTSSSIGFALNNKTNKIDFNSSIFADTAVNTIKSGGQVTNEYINPFIFFRNEAEKFSTQANLGLIRNVRAVDKSKSVFYNLQIDFNGVYTIDKRRQLTTKIEVKPNYPTMSQLTDIESSIGLISRKFGNLDLNPENKNEIEFDFAFAKSDSLKINLVTRFNLFTSKFGNRIINEDQIQQNVIDNLGSAISSDQTVKVAYTSANGLTLNYNLNLSYQQLPSIINEVKNLIEGTTITQSVSTSKAMFRNKITINPMLSFLRNSYTYDSNRNVSVSLTYSDRYTYKVNKSEINIFPFVNYNSSQINNFSWAANLEIKKNMFKNRVSGWIKIYDIFNSFKYVNNIVGDTYNESITNSNLRRYFLMGVSLKFNNIN